MMSMSSFGVAIHSSGFPLLGIDTNIYELVCEVNVCWQTKIFPLVQLGSDSNLLLKLLLAAQSQP